MTTEQTAQQLELAAQILRTGHPWGYRIHKGRIRSYVCPSQVIADGNLLIPILATPPDNRSLHNPDNLTAEAVGVGYRLPVDGDTPKTDHWIWVRDLGSWQYLQSQSNGSFDHHYTYRLPLSVPWPEPADPYAELKAAHAAGKVIECITGTGRRWMPMQGKPRWFLPVEDYRIKPTESAKPEPAFQLPSPPPGMRWHREDGWKADDLPQGYRPLVVGEKMKHSTDSFTGSNDRAFETVRGLDGHFPMNPQEAFYRTTRPLTFEHAGKKWTYHRPGDPMPCDGDSSVNILCRDEQCFAPSRSLLAKNVDWDECCLDGFDVLGWRYSDEKKTVPLGTEDVPPFSLLRVSGLNDPWNWMPVEAVDPCFGIRVISKEVSTSHEWLGWGDLKDREINRSIPLTGKWNPDAWEPCSKQTPA